MQTSNLQISFSDNDGTVGHIEGSVHIMENDNGSVIEYEHPFVMTMVKEDGVWHLYGDQMCVNRPVFRSKAERVLAQLGVTR
jgi:hypothetical protein